MKKNTLIAAAFATVGLAASGGFAQGLGATSVVAEGVKSGPVVQRLPDSAPVPGQNPWSPPAGGSSGGGVQVPVPPAPGTAPGSVAGTPGAPAAAPNAAAQTQAVPVPMPSFTPAEYKQAIKDSVLFNAAYAGETWNVKNAIAKGAKINSADWQYGFTPLMWAAFKGHLGTVRYLLNHGAKVNTRSKQGIRIVLAYRDEVTPGETYSNGMQLYWFKRSGATSEQGGVTALILASAGGYNLTVRELLSHGADPNVTTPGNDTALMFASYSGNLPTVNALLDKGAQLNPVDSVNANALFYAVHGGSKPVARLLLKKKIRTDIVDAQTHLTIADYARFMGMRDVAWSIDKGVKPKAKNVAAKKPVERAPLASGDNVVILN